MEYSDCIQGTRTVNGRVIRFRATWMPDKGEWTVRVVAPDGETEERQTYDVWAELPEMLDCAAPPPNAGRGGDTTPGVAQWLSPLELDISSLETGYIGFVCAGPATNGQLYNYSYAVLGGGSVSIDPDSGSVRLSSALTPGTHPITVKVTNRDDPSKSIDFILILKVRQGVTSNRTGDQILHKTYRPEQFGGDLVKLRDQLIADQEAAGDLNLRATIQFRRGRTYAYTNNHWVTGIQYYRCEAVGTGAAPILKNVLNDTQNFYESGPLSCGKRANCFYEGAGPLKSRMALVASARVGDTSVTLLESSDSSRLKPGRYHAVFSYSQQIGGYPPNVRWIDYCKVLSVDGATVKLDRPLNHDHFADYWEDPNDDYSIGKARIGTWDLADGKTYCSQRGVFVNINFQYYTTVGTQKLDITYLESHIHLVFDSCTITAPQISMSQFIEINNCTITTNGAPGKLSEVLVIDHCNVWEYLRGAAGFSYLLLRDSATHCLQISPRQFRCLGTTLNAHGDTHLSVPFGTAHGGPCLEYEFTNTEFIASSPDQATWSQISNPVTPLPLSGSSWEGNRLIIDRAFTGFENWLAWLYEGVMLFTGATVDKPESYGRVDKIYAPRDGSALWADVTWIGGIKPTSGNLNIPNHGLRRLTWGTGPQISQGSWLDPSFVCMSGTPADRPFPRGIG